MLACTAERHCQDATQSSAKLHHFGLSNWNAGSPTRILQSCAYMQASVEDGAYCPRPTPNGLPSPVRQRLHPISFSLPADLPLKVSPRFRSQHVADKQAIFGCPVAATIEDLPIQHSCSPRSCDRCRHAAAILTTRTRHLRLIERGEYVHFQALLCARSWTGVATTY